MELLGCKCRGVWCAGVGWNGGVGGSYRLQYAAVSVYFGLFCLFGMVYLNRFLLLSFANNVGHRLVVGGWWNF